MYNRTWLIALIIDNEIWNWGRNKKRMEFTGARVHPDITDAAFAKLKSSFVEGPEINGAAAAKAHPYMGWVRPLAVRCISGYSNGAVDLDLMTVTSRYNFMWIPKQGLLPGGRVTKGWISTFLRFLHGIPAIAQLSRTGSRMRERRAWLFMCQSLSSRRRVPDLPQME